MSRIGAVVLLALLMLPGGCTPGVHLSQVPLESNSNIDRIQALSLAISRSPRDPRLYAKRALAYENNGQYKTAIDDLNQAIQLRPDDPQYVFLRAIAYAYASNDSMARQDFDRATAMAPGSWQSYNARAWLWATAPDPKDRDGKRAVEYAAKACEMTGWQNAEVIGTLAAAYAEAGDFDNAVKWEQQAIDLTSPTLLVTLTERQGRLALYRGHQPWRPAAPNHVLSTSS